jgi:hypothetical protein
MEIRFTTLSFYRSFRVAGNLGVRNLQFPPFALAMCPALEEEEATAYTPFVLATCPALEDEEVMAQMRQRRVDSFSRRLRVGQGIVS